MVEDATLEALLRQVGTCPGSSTRALARTVGISESTADYHLWRLAKRGVVTSETAGRARTWYLAKCGLCPVLRSLMPTLRRPEAVAIALAADETYRSVPDLAARAGVTEGTTRWVTGVLSDAFVLERSKLGRVALREGAHMCISRAASGEQCDLWGKCPVSKAWGEARLDPVPARPRRT